MYPNKVRTANDYARNERRSRMWQAEFLMQSAVDPENENRLGFKDMTLSRTAHLLAALSAFRELIGNKESDAQEQETHRDTMMYWFNEFQRATGYRVNANTPVKDLLALRHGPNAVIQYEMLKSMGMDPEQEYFWEVLTSNMTTTHRIEAGELFACM